MTPLRVALTLFPFLWNIGMVPFVNRVKPMVLGLPFLAFWQVAGIFVAFVCLWGLYTIDSKHNGNS